MKFKVAEMMLNEYMNLPIEHKIDEIEALTIQEARKIADMRYPNRVIIVSQIELPKMNDELLQG